MWKEELYCNKMVVLVLPCRDVEEVLYCNKMVVLVLLCRDVEEELYCNKMVVLFYPSMDKDKLPTAKEKISSWPRTFID